MFFSSDTTSFISSSHSCIHSIYLLLVRMTMDAEDVAQLLDGISWNRRLIYNEICAYTIMVYDLVYTFPDEVRYMWPAPLSFPKVLFFLLRYYSIVHMYFNLSFNLPTGLSLEFCQSGFAKVTTSGYLIVIASEWILFICVWAFSGRDRRVLAFVLFQAIVIFGGIDMVLLVQFLRSVRFDPAIQNPTENIPCMPVNTGNLYLAGAFGLILWSVTSAYLRLFVEWEAFSLTVRLDVEGVMAIMIYYAIRRHRGTGTSLLTVFYRDGVFYFAVLSVLATLNIITLIRAPRGFQYAFSQIATIPHAVLSTRMLLHLRKWSEQKQGEAYGFRTEHLPSALQFNPSDWTLQGGLGITCPWVE
ncbi:hypothetical protein NMY22_g780 [Coprinellus aureogranulatus]|nr:hypothetical protein NMY22_g780 [Coprinellus aureogranulatus]